jgi:hypothetical protein
MGTTKTMTTPAIRLELIALFSFTSRASSVVFQYTSMYRFPETRQSQICQIFTTCHYLLDVHHNSCLANK